MDPLAGNVRVMNWWTGNEGVTKGQGVGGYRHAGRGGHRYGGKEEGHRYTDRKCGVVYRWTGVGPPTAVEGCVGSMAGLCSLTLPLSLLSRRWSPIPRHMTAPPRLPPRLELYRPCLCCRSLSSNSSSAALASAESSIWEDAHALAAFK